MDKVPLDQITLNLRFSVMTELGLYQDTLIFSEEEWAKRDDTVIEANKQALAAAWVMFRSAQIEAEQALATQEGKQAKLAEIDTKISALQAEADSLLGSL